MVETKGRVLHWTRGYDLLAWLLTFGREPAFREKILDLAELGAGQSALDVGSGTGTLAIRAKARVGASGYVCGIDASTEMIANARKKARRARADVDFQNAVVEALPFPNTRFNVVFSTLMLHHLPRPARVACAREARRVLLPGGRFVVVDFALSQRERPSLLDHFHRHGHVKPQEIVALLRETGFEVISSGRTGVRDLHFVVGRVP